MLVEYEENEAGEFVEKENYSPSPTPSPELKTVELSEEGEIIDSDDQVCEGGWVYKNVFEVST